MLHINDSQNKQPGVLLNTEHDVLQNQEAALIYPVELDISYKPSIGLTLIKASYECYLFSSPLLFSWCATYFFFPETLQFVDMYKPEWQTWVAGFKY